jgi:hypothetical protein
VHDAAAAAKSPKKFHVFHERHVWESTGLKKRSSPTENSMITASHPKQKPRIMRKGVRQPVNSRRGWQADAKETTTDFWILHYAANFVQRFRRHFGVRMQKPEDVAACGFGSDIHLFRTAALVTAYNPIAEALRQLVGAVGARAIDDNNFRRWNSVAQIRKKPAYRWRLIKHRNNDRDLHRRFAVNFSLRDNAPKGLPRNKMVARSVC